jgi:hypothetical protein
VSTHARACLNRHELAANNIHDSRADTWKNDSLRVHDLGKLNALKLNDGHDRGHGELGAAAAAAAASAARS